MADYLENLTTLPFAPLGIIAMPGCEAIGKKIDYYLTHDDERRQIAENGYRKVKTLHSYDERIAAMFEMSGLL